MECLLKKFNLILFSEYSQYPAGQAGYSYGSYAGDSSYSQSGYGGASTGAYSVSHANN